jgi:hypothetical protein
LRGAKALLIYITVRDLAAPERRAARLALRRSEFAKAGLAKPAPPSHVSVFPPSKPLWVAARRRDKIHRKETQP